MIPRLSRSDFSIAASPISIDPSMGSLDGIVRATSDVAGGETSSVAQNRLLNRQDNDIKGDVRRMTSLFTRAADKLGQPRVLNSRDFEVMEGWIRQGLIQSQWDLILSSHVAYCKDERREIARSLGYFVEPVKKMLSKSSSPKVQGMVKDLAKSMRLK